MNTQKIENFLIDLNIEENIYLLGFIWADGWLSNKSVHLSITKKDFNKIENIFKKFKISSISERQRYDKNGNKFGNPAKELYCYNTKIRNFLYENDYKLKSYVAPSKILKLIPNKLHYLFWRGYFDGDGCLYVGQKIELAFWSTIDQDWTSVTTLYDTLNIKNRSIYKYKRKNGKHCSSVIRIGISSDVKKFCEYIYKDRLDIGLKRKYKKYKELLKKYDGIQLNKVKTSKYIGVCFNILNKKWKSYIIKNRKNKLTNDIQIGWYPTEQEAFNARNSKLKQLNLI